jgi:nucleotide-binding universal stress UspA family protein
MGRIVVGVDGSRNADRALRWAVDEAELRGTTIELLYAYTMQLRHPLRLHTTHELADDVVDQIVDRNRDALDRVKWIATLVPLLGSSSSSALIEAGDEAELVVVGSRGLGGFAALLLGATSYRTAAHAPCPVAVIRGEGGASGRRHPRRIVVGIDDSRGARRALRWALEEAELHDVPVEIVHAYDVPTPHRLAGPPPDAQADQLQGDAREAAHDVVERALVTVDAAAGIEIQPVVAPGSPAGLLLDRVGPDTLLVVGTRGFGSIGQIVVGSVSHQCLHHADGPMVVVP